MRGKYYFIDFENTGRHAFTDMKYTENDMVYVFTTSHTPSLRSYDLGQCAAAIRFYHVPCGNQSLDMHLSTVLGSKIRTHGRTADYIIVSKDKGYDRIIRFWREKGYRVSRHEIEQESASVISDKEAARKECIALLVRAGCGFSEAESAANFYCLGNGANKKLLVYRASLKQFGKENGLKIYRAVKDKIAG